MTKSNKTEIDNYHCTDNDLPGASFYYDKPVETSVEIQEHIRQFFSCSEVLGPLFTYTPQDIVEQNNLSTAFLHTWVVDNSHDTRKLQDFCLENGYQVPSIIAYKLVNKMYSTNELMKDPKAHQDLIENLNRIDPTVANILIDYFNAHENS